MGEASKIEEAVKGQAAGGWSGRGSLGGRNPEQRWLRTGGALTPEGEVCAVP